MSGTREVGRGPRKPMKRLPGNVIARRIYPKGRTGLYVRVVIWPTRKALVAHVRSEGLKIPRGGAGACTITRHGKRPTPCIAEVHFCERQLDLESVAHEFLHATFAWARRVRFPFASLTTRDADEEPLSQAHGKMVCDFADAMRSALPSQSSKR